MPYYCTVPRCTSMAGKAKNVSFHQFPRDEQLAKLWNNILKRGKPYTKYSKVCSLHFKPEDYTITSVGKNKGQWRTLRKDAIPSQNLPLESPSYCRQQNPAALSSNDPSPDPQVIESQMRQMANIIYMQTMLAMQASNPRDANINESESASTTQGSEPNEHGEPLVLQTSQSNLNLEQLSRLPPFANFSNNDQSDNSNIGMPRSFKCNECFRLFKDPDVFLLHKRGHAKKENASEKENKNINSIEKTQETLRANPILANLLNSNMADKMQSIFNPNHISTIDNQIMAALAINMEVFIRNLSSVNEKKSDDSNESDNESENGEVDEKSDLAVSCDENNDECDEELKGDGVKNGDDCVKLEETVKSDCVVNEST